MNSDSLNIYLLVAFLLHSFFLFSFTIKNSVNDITTIGETGMAIQMIVLEKSDEVYDSKHVNFIVLELAKGGELYEQIIKNGGYSENESRKIFEQLLNVLEFCH